MDAPMGDSWRQAARARASPGKVRIGGREQPGSAKDSDPLCYATGPYSPPRT